jgi:hypothetical protein
MAVGYLAYKTISKAAQFVKNLLSKRFSHKKIKIIHTFEHLNKIAGQNF